jgi:hypothetical protein
LVPEPDPEPLNKASAISCDKPDVKEDPPDDAAWSFVR